MYTVYRHTNKLNGKVYIGITRQDVNADKEYTKPTRFPVGKHNNHHTSKVVRLDNDGNILGSYPSIIEAAKQTGFSANGISKCCSGWVKSYLGSRWSYA